MLGTFDINNVNLDIDAEETAALAISQAFADRLESMRPWYSFLARWQFLELVARLGGIVAVLSLVLNAVLYLANPRQQLDMVSLGRSLYIGIVIGAVIILMLTLFDRFRAALFPIATFVIGQGGKRHRDMEFWRKSVVVSFVVSLVAGVLVAQM
jgi:hypothetical protein